MSKQWAREWLSKANSSRLLNALSKLLTQIDLCDKASTTEWSGTREPGERGWGLDERAVGKRVAG